MMSYSIPVAVPGYSTRAGRPSTRVLYPGTGYRYRCTGYSCRYSQAYSSSTTRVELSQGFVALFWGNLSGKLSKFCLFLFRRNRPKNPASSGWGGFPQTPRLAFFGNTSPCLHTVVVKVVGAPAVLYLCSSYHTVPGTR